VVCAHAQVHALEIQEAVDRESCSGKQSHRQSELTGNEHAPQNT
jgi:hypothetical protein